MAPSIRVKFSCLGIMPKFTQPASAAAQACFGTVERFLTLDTDRAHDPGNVVNEAALREAYEVVSLHHAPPITRGTALLRQIEESVRFLNFGCQSIDQMLEGGAREGQVLELYGESGSGKTQLCMMACARGAGRGEKVVYIDTSNAFSGIRLVSILKKFPRDPNINVSLEQAVERVHVIRAYTAHAALAALDGLLRNGMGSPEHPRPNLVILDSLGAIIAPILGGGTHSQGHAVLAAAATLLKQVAAQLNAAVLVTNHMVGGGGGGTGAGGGRDRGVVETEKRPALGESWHYQAHSRVQLSLPRQEGGPWSAVVTASTLIAPGSTAQYWLTTGGAAAIPPQNDAAAPQQ